MLWSLVGFFNSSRIGCSRGDHLLSRRTSGFDAFDETSEDVCAFSALRSFGRDAVCLRLASRTARHGYPSQQMRCAGGR